MASKHVLGGKWAFSHQDALNVEGELDERVVSVRRVEVGGVVVGHGAAGLASMCVRREA